MIAKIKSTQIQSESDLLSFYLRTPWSHITLAFSAPRVKLDYHAFSARTFPLFTPHLSI